MTDKDELLTRVKEIVGHYGLRNLYDEEYAEHIKVGDRFRCNFSSDDEEYRFTKNGEATIVITYIRSGVVFYIIEGHPEKEFHFHIHSVMAWRLEPYSDEIELARIYLKRHINQIIQGQIVVDGGECSEEVATSVLNDLNTLDKLHKEMEAQQ